MSREVCIGGQKIGPGHPPFVICEISANHNGNINRAFDLIDEAAKTGCSAIKLQTYTADTMTIDHDSDEFKIKDGLWEGYNLYELYEEAHTPLDWHKAIFDRAKSKEVQIFSTPFDETAADFLDNLGVPAFKIASFELTDIPLIEHVAKKQKPIIVSTGMGNLQEIALAVETIRNTGNEDIILLHCVSSYPAPIEQSNVATVKHLSETFDVVSGLSDHTLSNAASISAIALGGSVIEKHFTIDRTEGGPDSAFSLEPREFSMLCNECHNAWQAVGRPDYTIKQSEVINLKFRRSIYFVKDLKAGEIISLDSVRVIRPGYGLSPVEIRNIIGRKVKFDVKRGTPVKHDDLE